MKSIQAFEGVGMRLHRTEGAALAEIIYECGEGTLKALLNDPGDKNYQPRVRAAILRAADLLRGRK